MVAEGDEEGGTVRRYSSAPPYVWPELSTCLCESLDEEGSLMHTCAGIGARRGRLAKQVLELTKVVCMAGRVSRGSAAAASGSHPRRCVFTIDHVAERWDEMRCSRQTHTEDSVVIAEPARDTVHLVVVCDDDTHCARDKRAPSSYSPKVCLCSKATSPRPHLDVVDVQNTFTTRLFPLPRRRTITPAIIMPPLRPRHPRPPLRKQIMVETSTMS